MIDRRFLDIKLTVLGVANIPKSNPSTDDMYIVGSNPEGEFAGFSGDDLVRYNGSTWVKLPDNARHLEVFNLQTGTFMRYYYVSGRSSQWENISVAGSFSIIKDFSNDEISRGDTLPSSCSAGNKFINTSENKIYTATGENTWGTGVAISNGDKFLHIDSGLFHLLVYENSTCHDFYVNDGDCFFDKSDKNAYIHYNGTIYKLGGASPYTEKHVLTAQEAENKSFYLSYPIASGQENNILLFVSGVAQVVGTDFTASGNQISWDQKGLDYIGLTQGDTFVIHYVY